MVILGETKALAWSMHNSKKRAKYQLFFRWIFWQGKHKYNNSKDNPQNKTIKKMHLKTFLYCFISYRHRTKIS